MKATELTKKSVDIKAIYDEIGQSSNGAAHKIFYPHWLYISNDVKLDLMKDGFKVYDGEWMKGDYGLIIEW